MSRIYFHTRGGRTAELLGSERAYMGLTVQNITGALFREEVWRMAFSDTGPLGVEWYRMPTRMLFGVSSDFSLEFDGHREDGWTIGLNTAIATRSPALCLLARIHAQCEIHGWVAEDDRTWLAGVIGAGLSDRILRQGMGWDRVGELLLDTSEPGPVVMSYSVTEGFPNMLLSGCTVDEDGESPEWEAMAPEDQWDTALAALHPSLQVTPESLFSQGFGSGKSAWDVLASESYRTAGATP